MVFDIKKKILEFFLRLLEDEAINEFENVTLFLIRILWDLFRRQILGSSERVLVYGDAVVLKNLSCSLATRLPVGLTFRIQRDGEVQDHKFFYWSVIHDDTFVLAKFGQNLPIR